MIFLFAEFFSFTFFLLILQLCLSVLLFVSATAESGKKASDTKAVPLEKKLDKRGLLDLGYGYGINGLDVGYLGGGHLGGAYLDDHHGHDFHHGYNGLHGYGGYGNGFYLGGHTDTTKIHTIVKGVPVPYTVEKHVPHIVEKHVPYKVAVPVPQPYEVIKHVPVPVKEYVKVPVHVPQPYPVEKIKHVPVHVPVDRPYPVKVYVPQVIFSQLKFYFNSIFLIKLVIDLAIPS